MGIDLKATQEVFGKRYKPFGEVMLRMGIIGGKSWRWISKKSYGLKVQGFLMCGEMVDNNIIIMMQNPLHVGKKLWNPLLSTTRIVFWGKHMANKNHMLLVLEIFNKDQHGLLEEDINVKDKKKIPIVQRITFPKVRKCFEVIDEGMQF